MYLKLSSYSLFHSTRYKGIPNHLPKLEIENIEIKRDSVTKFLGVLIDENLTWKPQIENVCKKVSKSIGVLYQARPFLSKHLLQQLYFAFVHSHLNYCNIAWGSTHRTKLERLYRYQKHAIRILNYKDRFTHTKPLFLDMKILNIFDMNIFQTLCTMFKCKMKVAPEIFHKTFTLKPENKYTMRSKGKLFQPCKKTNLTSFCFSYRGPHMWNKIIFVNRCLSDLDSFSTFKLRVKDFLLTEDSILKYF